MSLFTDVPEAIKTKMDAKGELVNKATKIFKNIYLNSVKPIFVSQIVKGEIIKTLDDNIFIDEDRDPDFNEKLFEQQCRYTTKELYDYQKDAIRKLVQLEKRGYNCNSRLDSKIISNGWLLSLPIGAGKSIVFEFLAVFYRDVPMHPIIISTDGQAIDKFDNIIEFDKYPFYYENCGYIEKDANSVVVMKNYRRRNCTVILTHTHLIDQMEMYFKQDFPTIFNNKNPQVRIAYTLSLHGIDIDKLDILVIEASTQNIQQLVALSYQAPFMRVIIDDYTSMNDIGSFREILASSTIFVSGSKFQREINEIPTSYYTLKNIPYQQLSVVGKPEDTLQGILRDNIATLELMGTSCEFNMYSFVNACEGLCKSYLKCMPSDCYPIIRTENKIKHYFALTFILNHIAKVKSAILNVENALEGNRLDAESVSYYLKWKEMLKDAERPPPTEIIESNGKRVRKQITPSSNPLYNYIYNNKTVSRNSDGTPVLKQHCYVCGAAIDKHRDYGMISNCCGAFICSDCYKCSTTHYITNSETNETIKDEDNCYCICCREKNPTYIFNINHKKDTANVHSYHIAQLGYDISALTNHNLFDYYFYMCLHGFKPLYSEGKAINIKKDIELNMIPAETFKKQLVPTMDKLYSVDHLALLAIHTINLTLRTLNILPHPRSTLLIYACPVELQERVRNFYKNIVTTNDPATAFTLYNDTVLNKNNEADAKIIADPKKKKVTIQPIARMQLEFMSEVSSLIGLHKNIVGIIQWTKPKREDEVAQLIGRCLRLNNFGNKLYFYITTSSTEFE